MPDITMCNSLTCNKRFECYRFLAKPNRIQSYSDFPNCIKENNYPDFVYYSKREGDSYEK